MGLSKSIAARGWAGFALTAMGALVGCGGTEAASRDPAEDAKLTGPASALIPGAAPPAKWVDASGRTFVLRGKAAFRVVKPGELKQAAPNPGTAAEAPAAASIEDFADRLRPVTVVGEYEYILEKPDLDTARAVLAAIQRGPSATPDTEPGGGRDGRNCCGTDDRTNDRSNTGSTEAPTTFSEIGCSGTMISPSVLLTAAHCVYDTVNNAWLQVPTEPSWGSGNRWPRYAHGVDGLDADPAPFTHSGTQSFDVTKSASGVFSTVAPGAYIQCYDVFITNGFVNASFGGGTDDYALIDFKKRCNYSPGSITSWWGTWARDTAGITANTAWMYGYPATAQNGANINSATLTYRDTSLWSGVYTTGQIWTDNGTPTIDSGATWQLRYTSIDTTGGDSGAGIYQVFNGTPRYLIGSHIGVASGDAYNFGRRWDSTTSAFATANTVFPN